MAHTWRDDVMIPWGKCSKPIGGCIVFVLAFLGIVCLFPAVLAAETTDSATTYTINLAPDGTASWVIEYRTPLLQESDTQAFEEYSNDLESRYLPEIENLMKSSAGQAGAATSRPMAVENFTGAAVILTTPSGKSGVVTITFTWTDFASRDNGLVVGDVFSGGMYLSKDDTLIINYPHGYVPASVDPEPDRQNPNSCAWYGVRSFTSDTPRIALEENSLPLIPLVLGIVLILVVVAGYFFIRKRKADSDDAINQVSDVEDSVVEGYAADMPGIQDRITSELKGHGGEMYQSDLVKTLGIPKSTLSSALNDLHQRNIIIKIKKGRENLIRLADPTAE